MTPQIRARRAVAAVLLTLTAATGCSSSPSDERSQPSDVVTTSPQVTQASIDSGAPAPVGQDLVATGPVDRTDPDSTGDALARVAALWDTRTDAGPADAVLRAGDLVGEALLAEYATNRTERPPLSWREPGAHGAHLQVEVTPGAHTDYEGQLVPDSPTTVWRTYTLSATWVGEDGWTSEPVPLTVRTQLRKTENRWTAAQLTIQETT